MHFCCFCFLPSYRTYMYALSACFACSWYDMTTGTVEERQQETIGLIRQFYAFILNAVSMQLRRAIIDVMCVPARLESETVQLRLIHRKFKL